MTGTDGLLGGVQHTIGDVWDELDLPTVALTFFVFGAATFFVAVFQTWRQQPYFEANQGIDAAMTFGSLAAMVGFGLFQLLTGILIFAGLIAWRRYR